MPAHLVVEVNPTVVEFFDNSTSQPTMVPLPTSSTGTMSPAKAGRKGKKYFFPSTRKENTPSGKESVFFLPTHSEALPRSRSRRLAEMSPPEKSKLSPRGGKVENGSCGILPTPFLKSFTKTFFFVVIMAGVLPPTTLGCLKTEIPLFGFYSHLSRPRRFPSSILPRQREGPFLLFPHAAAAGPFLLLRQAAGPFSSRTSTFCNVYSPKAKGRRGWEGGDAPFALSLPPSPRACLRVTQTFLPPPFLSRTPP